MGLWRGRFRHGHRRERYWTRRPKLTVSILPPPSRQQRAANVVSPRCGCHLTVADKALLHNAQFVIIRPIPAAFTIGSRQNFDLRAVDKVGHKGGLTIGANTSSDGRPRRLTIKTGSTERLNRSASPGPAHRFTVSKIGRDSLRQNDGTAKQHLSRAAMGTNVPPCQSAGSYSGLASALTYVT